MYAAVAGYGVVAELVEHVADGFGDGSFVVNHQNRFVFAAGDGGFRFFAADIAVAQGKVDMNCGSLAGLAVNGDCSLMALNDAVNDRQPQSGTLVGRFRTEKRLENPLKIFLVDSDTGIAYGQADLFHSRFQARPRFCHPGGRAYRLQSDGQRPALFLHRLNGIGAEVHDDLVHLGGIGQDFRTRG